MVLFAALQLFSERCERPYAGLNAEQTALYVVNGGRLDRPSNCDDDIYSVMRTCWKHHADRRPSPAVLHRRLAALRSASGPSDRRSTASTPPPPPLPLRPTDSNTMRQTARSRTSKLSLTSNNSCPTLVTLLNVSQTDHQSLQPRSPLNNDVTSSTDVVIRSAAVRIRDSFRKFVTSRRVAITDNDVIEVATNKSDQTTI